MHYEDNTKMKTLCCYTLEMQKIWSLPCKEGFEFLLCSPLHFQAKLLYAISASLGIGSESPTDGYCTDR